MKEYDIVVLGAGPGGYVAAIHAAQKGASVAIVERKKVGGVCLNDGCIPTKTLVHNAEIMHLAQQASKRGIHFGEIQADIEQGMQTKDKIVAQLTSGVESLLKAHGVEVYATQGTPTANHTVQLENANPSEIAYRSLILATGSCPAVPPIQGIGSEGVMDSTQLLQIKRVPKHLIIIGGGVVGCEFASVFRAYGSEVTVVEMLPTLLSGMDKDVSKILQNAFRTQKIETRTGTVVERIEQKGEHCAVYTLKDGVQTVLEGDVVLLSTGRAANTQALRALHLEMDNGFVKVDETLCTSRPNVYAIGDLTGKLMLAHVATAMGICAVNNCLGKAVPISLHNVPSCVFTSPEIGAVGLTEEEAQDIYGDILVGKFPLAASGKAIAMGAGAGLYKVVADAENHRIVGAHMVGVGATELVSTAAAYLTMRGTLEDVEATIFAHPTLSECFMEAAHDALGHCVHLPPKTATRP